ncbi:MAG: ABC transporter substrate-binding protein [Actinomycetes bacterium]
MTGTRRIRLLALLAAVGLAVAPAATTAQAASSSPPASPAASAAPDAKTFTVGILQDVDSMNPFVGIVAEAYEMWGLMYDQLIGYGQKDFAPVPQLAESWQESADKKSWTYKIRSGVKWSDGTPLTARDAAYTFQRIIDGEFEQTNYGNYVANITKAEAPDDTTLVLHVKQPSPTMLRLAVPILPEHIWKGIDAKKVQTFDNETQAVGSGPFVFAEHKTGQFLRFTANPSYWAGAPKVKEVVFRIFTNEDAAVQALRKGEIDFLDGLSANPFKSLQNAQGIKAVPAKYSGFDELAFNTGAATDKGEPIGDGHPALKDKQVRLAIAHAIDRKTLVDRVLGGNGSPGTTVIPPLYQSQHYDPGDATYAFDLAKANQILDDAGYKKGPDGIRTMPGGGRKLSLRLFGRTESQSSQQSVQFIQGWLKAIGIATKVSIVEENRLTEIIGQGEFDMFEWGWVVEPDPDYQLSTFTCGQRSTKDGSSLTAGLSDSFYCNPAFDALYEKQKVTTDIPAREEVVKQAQKMLYDDVPYVITFYYDELQAYRSDRFTNLKPQPEPDGVLLFQYGTYTYREVTPVSEAQKKTASEGVGTGLVVAAGVGAAALLGAGFLFVGRRRRTGADDRE